jgi:hypothetical protein
MNRLTRYIFLLSVTALISGCVVYGDAGIRIAHTRTTDSIEHPTAQPGHKVLRIDFDASISGQINTAKGNFVQTGKCDISKDFVFISSLFLVDPQTGALKPVFFSENMKSGRFAIFFNQREMAFSGRFQDAQTKFTQVCFWLQGGSFPKGYDSLPATAPVPAEP